MHHLSSIEDIQHALQAQRYIAERGLATTIFLALKMGRPLFLEGEAGVGKTEVAKVLAATLDVPLIRLQCYEGLDVHTAVYEWIPGWFDPPCSSETHTRRTPARR